MKNKNDDVIVNYEKFTKNYEIQCEAFPPYHETIKLLMKKKKITNQKLAEISGLAPRTITAFRTGEWKNNKGEVCKNYRPKYNDMVAFCIACDIDLDTAAQLLNSAGLTFSKTNLIHKAYCFVLAKCEGRTIEECNDVLRQLNVEEKYLLRENKDW